MNLQLKPLAEAVMNKPPVGAWLFGANSGRDYPRYIKENRPVNRTMRRRMRKAAGIGNARQRWGDSGWWYGLPRAIAA